MKKLIMLAVLALVSTVTFGQIKWNAQAGINMSTMSDLDESKMVVGYQVGVGMEYAFDEMWSIRPSLLLVQKGAKQEFDYGADGSEEYKYNPLYIQLPIMAAASFDLTDNMKFVVKAGPYLGFGIGGKAKYEDYEPGEGTFQIKYDFFDDGFDRDGYKEYNGAKKFDFGLGIGAGLEFGQILVNLDTTFGLTKVNKIIMEDYHGNKKEHNPKNISVALSVGYKF